MGKIKIFADGIIYKLQKNGGISRYFHNLIENIQGLDPEVEIKNVTSSPTSKLYNFLLKAYLLRQASGIFHASYYIGYENLKIPQVVTVYDLIYEKFPQYFNLPAERDFVKQKKRVIQNADMIICISKAVKNDVKNHFQIDDSRLTVTHLGVSPIFKQIQVKNQKFTEPFFLYIGYRGKYKNFKRLAQALAKIQQHQPINIVCIGGGNFTKEETQFLKKLKIKNSVRHLPTVSDQELVSFYNAALALIIPSLDEGFGLPLLEAMACGCLVGASDLPVFKEIAGSLPFYFNPLKIDSIAKTLKTLLQSNQTGNRIQLGMRCTKKFTWEKTAQKTLEIYDHLQHHHTKL